MREVGCFGEVGLLEDTEESLFVVREQVVDAVKSSEEANCFHH